MDFEISLLESETRCAHFNICINCMQGLADRNYKPLCLFHKAFFKRQPEYVIKYSECFLDGEDENNFYSFVTTILFILMFSYS